MTPDAPDPVTPVEPAEPRRPTRRDADARQALVAIALVFFLGIVIGFVLAHTL